MKRALASLALFSAGCVTLTDFGNWEEARQPPDSACCPSVAPRFFQCIVALNGPGASLAPGTSPTPATVAQCFPGIEQARAGAIAIAQTENPTLTTRDVSCEPTGCPGANITDAAETDAGAGTDGGAP